MFFISPVSHNDDTINANDREKRNLDKDKRCTSN